MTRHDMAILGRLIRKHYYPDTNLHARLPRFECEFPLEDDDFLKIYIPVRGSVDDDLARGSAFTEDVVQLISDPSPILVMTEFRE